MQHSMKFPYIIAEAVSKSRGNLDTAKRLIEEAAEGGANAIKFQTYSKYLSVPTLPHIGTPVKKAQLVNSSYSVNLISSEKMNLSNLKGIVRNKISSS